MRHYKDALELSEMIAPKLKGISYVLLMAMPSENGSKKDYVPYPRDLMPCWGGDMRKYYETHGDSCTQPEDDRPTDLYQPFPKEGFPVAVVLKFKFRKDILEDILEYTPYGKAFKDIQVKMTDQTVSLESIDGRSFPVDPSAIVSFIFFMNRFTVDLRITREEFYENYKKLKEAVGARYAMLMVGTTGLDVPCLQQPAMKLLDAYGYNFANVNLLAFIKGEYRELSGGHYGDGYDYNRKDISLFLSPADDRKVFAADFNSSITQRYHYDSITYKYNINLLELASELKTYVEEFVKEENSQEVEISAA